MLNSAVVGNYACYVENLWHLWHLKEILNSLIKKKKKTVAPMNLNYVHSSFDVEKMPERKGKINQMHSACEGVLKITKCVFHSNEFV